MNTFNDYINMQIPVEVITINGYHMTGTIQNINVVQDKPYVTIMTLTGEKKHVFLHAISTIEKMRPANVTRG